MLITMGLREGPVHALPLARMRASDPPYCRDAHRDGGRGNDRNKRESSAERRAKIAAWNKERTT